MGWDVRQGDTLELAKALPDNSIDAIVTDPPAGIEFMHCGWDTFKQGESERDSFIAFMEAVAVEALRVLKPGGYALVWAIPRTSHWTATALEQAGFEIREIVHHLFGSGFPKGLDLGKALDRMRDDDIYHVTAFVAAARDKAGLSNGEIDAVLGYTGMAGHWTSAKSQPAVPKWEQWLELKVLLRFGDEMDAEVQRLNGRKGKPGDLWYDRPVVGTVRDGVDGHLFRKAGGRLTYHKEFAITEPVTDEARRWDGWNTALKPAVEHWILARKPIQARNNAMNVLTWGVGALNIRGCEVGQGFGGKRVVGKDGEAVRRQREGRWPSNLVLSHTPACYPLGQVRVRGSHSMGACQGKTYDRSGKGYVFGEHGDRTGHHHVDADGLETVEEWGCPPGCAVAELDVQSGQSRSPERVVQGGQRGYTATWEGSPGSRRREVPCYGDRGGASRFFPAFRPDARGEVELLSLEVYREKESGWESVVHGVRLLVDTGRSRPRVIDGCGIPSNAVGEWSMTLFGSVTTDPSLKESGSIIGMGTSSETQSETLSWLTRSLTSESTPVACGETELSGSPVVGVGTFSPSIAIMCDGTVSLPGVGVVASRTLWRISAVGRPEREVVSFLYQPKPSRTEKEAGCEWLPPKTLNRVNAGGLENDPRWKPLQVRNNHPTCKSIGLMRWLCRLICPPGGTVLDLFCGSGTTGCGAVLEGFDFLGFEREEPFVEIARARIVHWAEVAEEGGPPLERTPVTPKALRAREVPKVLGLKRKPERTSSLQGSLF